MLHLPLRRFAGYPPEVELLFEGTQRPAVEFIPNLSSLSPSLSRFPFSGISVFLQYIFAVFCSTLAVVVHFCSLMQAQNYRVILWVWKITFDLLFIHDFPVCLRR